MSNTIGRHILRFVPGGWVGALEFLSGSHHRFYPWGPMNGQTARLETARTMIHYLAIKQIIETGTYRGTTTQWLASFGLPVTTIEISQRFYSFARRRLRSWRNVEVLRGESTVVLKELMERLGDKRTPTFLYLDAHWHDYLPLAEELQLISSNLTTAYVMVDDFQVPGDEGYGYDDYGPEKQLTLSYVMKHFSGEFFTFFPRAKAAHETGNRRGWVVFAFDKNSANRLKEIPGLVQALTGRESVSS